MRLPQSQARRLSLPLIALAAIITLAPAKMDAATQQLSCWPARLRFGTVPVGQSETMLVTLTNNGKTSVTVSAINSSSASFKVTNLKLPQVLSAGQSVDISVTFKPANDGRSGGLVAFSDSASSTPVRVAVSGSGVVSDVVTASPASVSFGKVTVGNTATVPVVLTNAHSWKVTLLNLQIAGSQFSVSGASFPLTLAGGKSVTLSVSFTPTTAGLTGGSAFVGGPALNIPLSGTGAGSTGPAQLTISPSTLSFGNVVDGSTATQSTVLTASGGSVTVSSVSSSNAQFAVPGQTFPLNITAGHSVSMNVTFTPQNSGQATATLTFVSNASDSSATEGLAGTGTTPYVNLSWEASTSDVVGYNVYRKTASSNYSKLNSSLVGNTSFTDSNVVVGSIYYYVTTAVNSSGQESSYSNQVEVQVQ